MTHRLASLLFAGSLVLAAGWASSQADAQQAVQPQGSPGGFLSAAPAAKLQAQYAAMPRGQSFTSRGETYVVLPGVRALAAGPAGQPAGLDVIERKGRFVLYREARAEMQHDQPMLAQEPGAGAVTHAVVLNSRTGRAGVVLGTILVKLLDMNQAPALAADYGLTLSSRFDHLGVAFYTVAPGQDIAAAAALLRSDIRVASADPEILETPRVPN